MNFSGHVGKIVLTSTLDMETDMPKNEIRTKANFLCKFIAKRYRRERFDAI